MKTFSLGEFAAHLLTMEADVKLAEEAAVVKGCKIVQRAAKGMLGTPQPFWAPLKPETIAQKARGDTPLLETGELKRSIEMTAPIREGNTVYGYVGSNSMIAVYQELGTSRIPPRSFLGSAAMGKEREIVEMTGRLVYGAMVDGGRNFRELREVLHLLHKAYESAKDLLPDDEDGDKESSFESDLKSAASGARSVYGSFSRVLK